MIINQRQFVPKLLSYSLHSLNICNFPTFFLSLCLLHPAAMLHRQAALLSKCLAWMSTSLWANKYSCCHAAWTLLVSNCAAKERKLKQMKYFERVCSLSLKINWRCKQQWRGAKHCIVRWLWCGMGPLERDMIKCWDVGGTFFYSGTDPGILGIPKKTNLQKYGYTSKLPYLLSSGISLFYSQPQPQVLCLL